MRTYRITWVETHDVIVVASNRHHAQAKAIMARVESNATLKNAPKVIVAEMREQPCPTQP